MNMFNGFVEFYSQIEPAIFILLQVIFLAVPLLLSMAYLVYAERRIIGFMQLRLGPNVAGPFGILQPLADALKLMLKEVIIPFGAKWKLFLVAPMITFILSMICWSVLPIPSLFGGDVKAIANINVGVLYLLAISSLSVYGIIIAGWASNSKYAFLGAIRCAAQMISYELLIGISLMPIVITAGSLNLFDIVEKLHLAPMWVKLLNAPMCVIFFIAILAETNRHPFDLAEAEAELVGGFNVEYSSMAFALFFLGEYLNMILSAAMVSILFLGGWYPPFEFAFLYKIPALVWLVLKMFCVLFVFIWLRTALPRYRYDQLMRIGWKLLIPLSFVWFIFEACILYALK